MVTEAETEVARLIAYVNDDVVPEVRRGSSRGLRAAAEQLEELAQHLDRGGAHGSSARAEAKDASAQASASR